MLVDPNSDLAHEIDNNFLKANTGSFHLFKYALMSFQHPLHYVQQLCLAEIIPRHQWIHDRFGSDCPSLAMHSCVAVNLADVCQLQHSYNRGGLDLPPFVYHRIVLTVADDARFQGLLGNGVHGFHLWEGQGMDCRGRKCTCRGGAGVAGWSLGLGGCAHGFGKMYVGQIRFRNVYNVGVTGEMGLGGNRSQEGREIRRKKKSQIHQRARVFIYFSTPDLISNNPIPPFPLQSLQPHLFYNTLPSFSNMRKLTLPLSLTFSTPKPPTTTSLGTMTDHLRRQHQKVKQLKKIQAQNLPAQELYIKIQQYLCKVTLFMRHDEWKSQYVHAWMNYQKLGFRVYSDYSYLKDMAKFYKINKKPQNQQYPLVKFATPKDQPVILHGLNDIIQFFKLNKYAQNQVTDNRQLESTLQKYIDEQIVTNLQALFWHPSLTWQYLFHINLSLIRHEQRSSKIVAMLYYNVYRVTKNIIINLYNIMKYRDRYEGSKDKLTNGLREVMKSINNKQFIGGNKPSHMDFYLYAVLSTRGQSKNFQKYLKNQISGSFWQWYYRMQRLTRYDSERITLL